VGRFEQLDLWADSATTTSATTTTTTTTTGGTGGIGSIGSAGTGGIGSGGGSSGSTTTTVPKYTLTILDYQASAPRSCAVFFVPFGREASYQFTAQECLADIANQAMTKRLLVVRCNRPHVFPDMKVGW
jgi:hypothetical protein